MEGRWNSAQSAGRVQALKREYAYCSQLHSCSVLQHTTLFCDTVLSVLYSSPMRIHCGTFFYKTFNYTRTRYYSISDVGIWHIHSGMLFGLYYDKLDNMSVICCGVQPILTKLSCSWTQSHFHWTYIQGILSGSPTCQRGDLYPWHIYTHSVAYRE